MTRAPDHADAAASWPCGRVGYVALLGRPNTGKSTFLNTVLDYHLAPVSAKPQTTRRRCLGVCSKDDSQVLFHDAPGVHKARDELDAAMLRAVDRALEAADVILCLCDASRQPGAEDATVGARAGSCAQDVVVAVNKVDIAGPAQAAAMAAFYRRFLPTAPVHETVATCMDTLEPVLADIRSRLPRGPFLYPRDAITDRYERDIGAELIREAALELYRAEVPHALAVAIEAWEELPERRRISAALFVEREQQKRIVIGHEGRMIKRLRALATAKLLELCGCPVELHLWVKVAPDWRRNQARIREFDL